VAARFALQEKWMKSLASAKVLAETRDRLLCLREDDQPLWGKMTAPQMVRHLSCAYEVALGDRDVAPVKSALPPPVMKWIALRSGLQWPKNVRTTPELIRVVEEECDGAFAELVMETTERMELVAKGTRWQMGHPMFGPMSAMDWMRWGYLHADHHLRQFGR
jgi:hypothetical protein